VTILPERNVKIVTVILDNSSPATLKDLRCNTCGKIVTQYYDELRIVIFDEVREVIKRPHDILCKFCKVIYRII